MSEDIVDRVIRESQEAWPGFDAVSDEAVLRLLRAYHFMDQELTVAQIEFDLNPGEFGVLIELRLAGEPYKLTPTQLYNRLLVTSGGMTGRIDRLEGRDLVRRLPDPNDRRSVLVELTQSGFELIEVAVRKQHSVEAHLVEALTVEERHQLVGLVRKVLSDIETHDCCEVRRRNI